MLGDEERRHGAAVRTVGLEIISRRECLQLLCRQRVGRVAFVAGDQPMVLPVNYAIHGGTIVFRTGMGTKLEAMRSSKVAFELDELDVANASGWSVVDQGVAEDITDADDLTAGLLRDSAVPSWVPGDRSLRLDRPEQDLRSPDPRLSQRAPTPWWGVTRAKAPMSDREPRACGRVDRPRRLGTNVPVSERDEDRCSP